MIPPIDTARLRQARLALRKSQETIARMFGVTHATYNRWENGRTEPCATRRERLWRLIEIGERTPHETNG